MYPFKTFSWTIVSETVAIKEMDKSAFIHHGTGIPQKILSFFGLENHNKKDQLSVSLIFKNQTFKGYFNYDATHTRIRLFWKSDFEKEIKGLFPSLYDLALKNNFLPDDVPKIRFQKSKVATHEFDISFILPAEISLDINEEENKEELSSKEGAKKEFWSTRYERDLKNRQRALEIHGFSCIVCGFNFGKTYGDRGEGFIEIHHTVPLASLNEETFIKPETDLVPVCSNCHRMIHRRKDKILSVQELRKVTKKCNF